MHRLLLSFKGDVKWPIFLKSNFSLQVFYKFPTSSLKSRACRHHDLDTAAWVFWPLRGCRTPDCPPSLPCPKPPFDSKPIMQMEEAWWLEPWTLNIGLCHPKDVFLWPLKPNISPALSCQGYVFIRKLHDAVRANPTLQIAIWGCGDDATLTLDVFQLLSGRLDWLPSSGWSTRNAVLEHTVWWNQTKHLVWFHPKGSLFYGP